MKFRFHYFLFAFICVGCTPSPTVTSGKFEDVYTLTMQRGSVEIVVETSSRATYKVTNYSMNHPMGRRPDTEATFTTSGGIFIITDRNESRNGVNINGTFYDYPEPSNGRGKITINKLGTITVHPPNLPKPVGTGS